MSTKKTEKTELTLYHPEDFCIKPCKLFVGEFDDWQTYCSKDGYLRIRPLIFYGSVGVEGYLALGVPPNDFEVDAWEASRQAGTWDFWDMLGLITVPAGDYASNVILYFNANTFFNRDLDVLHTLPGNTTCTNLEESWEELFTIFQKSFGATKLSGQIWVSPNGTLYDGNGPAKE